MKHYYIVYTDEKTGRQTLGMIKGDNQKHSEMILRKNGWKIWKCISVEGIRKIQSMEVTELFKKYKKIEQIVLDQILMLDLKHK